MLPDGTPTSAFRLPEGWSDPERVEDSIDADGLELHRAGLSSRSAAGEALGAAADWSGSPLTRSYFELLERITVLDLSQRRGDVFAVRSARGEIVSTCRSEDVFPSSPAPSLWTYARSSGVALHVDWKTACERAEQELVERDRVQRAWLGEIEPRPLPLDASSPLAKTRSYDWRAYELPPHDGAELRSLTRVVALFGFPVRASAPLVFGYGARTSLHDALGCATSEALQVLAFLWGEPLPDRLPEPAPTPMAHLERYQFPATHDLLRRWLEGGHRRHRRCGSAPGVAAGSIRFVDITPAWLTGRLHVARALCESAISLTFGQSPVFAHLPPELRVHPIP